MKGLILCAGKGTRLQPFSFSQPKTLLPVANKPVLFYGIEQLVKAGITDVGIVINNNQKKLMEEIVGFGDRFNANITYIFQNNPLGIADAVRTAESFIAKESFILLLGDNLIWEPLHVLRERLERHEANACISLAEVENPQDYGIAEIEGGKIKNLEEKPKEPKSNLAVIGAYAFDETIFAAIRSIYPSQRGEYEITDAIQWLIDRGHKVSYSVTDSNFSDVGNVFRWLAANRWMLDKVTDGENIISSDVQVHNCTIYPPVIIGDGCRLKDCEIGPYVSIQSGALVEGCKIENSIVLKGARLKHISHTIRNSVFGEHAEVIGSVDVFKYHQYILGDHSLLKNV
jgi:glucose-1-phosphate thymidylyltransferase